jgi:hypothetical protein
MRIELSPHVVDRPRQEKLMLKSHLAATPAAALIVALSMTVVPATTAGAGDRVAGSTVSTVAQEELGAVAATSVSVPIQRASAALQRAVTQLRAHHYAEARASLETVRIKGRRAQEIATSLIGAPPTDPESDDVPGPPAVLAVLGLEHRITMQVVDLFNGQKGQRMVRALRTTLWATHGRRTIMLDKVIALPAEGARADYSDGMADTLGIYRQEVTSVTTALETYRLSPSGRIGLRRALVRVKATNLKVNRAFGGGE